MPLLDDVVLEQSGIVANCRMNRERILTGANGYAKEVRFHPLDFLKECAALKGKARWLDLCCGTGKALIEAASLVEREKLNIHIVGIDLVENFNLFDNQFSCLELIQASLSHWESDSSFDLITCVHGLHYIGDKLDLLARASSWLTENGRLVANLDLDNIKLEDGRIAKRTIANEIRHQGFEYSFRKKLIQKTGKQHIALPFQYQGADDQAGPNYTGQPAVDSFYKK